MRLLGESAVMDDSGSSRTRSRRAVALTAYLALHAGIPQQRSLIAGLFWSDSSGAQALTNLRRELHTLRGMLPADALAVTATDLCWQDSPGCSVDLRQFAIARSRALAATAPAAVVEHGHRAASAYGGDFLPGTYDDWALEARDELRRQCLDLHRRVVTAAREIGDYPTAIDAARRAVAFEPLDERGHRTLMTLYAETGDRARVISSFHRCASVLEKGLGIGPDAETTAIVVPFLGDAPAGAPRQRPKREVGDTGFVGREAAMTLLLSAWETVASTRRPQVVVVRGEAGIGKTRLATEVARELADRGAAIAVSQCFATAGRVSLAPVADWLRSQVVRRAAATVEPVWRHEVTRLLPDRSAQRETRSERVLVNPWQRHRFFEGLARALLAPTAPLLLVLDNAQWCDEETLALLSFLLKMADAHRLLVLMTVRPPTSGSDPPVTRWCDGLAGMGLLTTVDLTPLDRDATTALAKQAGQHLDVVAAAALHSATGGFPLYVLEVIRAGFDPSLPEVSQQVADVLRRRLRQASAPARAVAGLAAAVGRDFSLDLLTEATDLPPDALVRAIDELWRARIVRDIDQGYDFAHDLLRDVAYDQISPPQRWLLHRRLAQALEILHAGRTEEVAVELAEQHSRAGQPERALRYYVQAADASAERFAYAESVHFHELALDIVRRLPPGRRRDQTESDILRALIPPLNAWKGGAWPPLGDVLQRLVELTETADQKLLVDGLVGLWTCRFVQGRMYEAERIADRAMALPIDDPHLLPQVLTIRGGSALSMGRPAEAVEFLLRASGGDSIESLIIGPHSDVVALGWASHALWLAGRYSEAELARERMVERAHTSGHPYLHAIGIAYAAVYDQFSGDRDALADSVAVLRDVSTRYEFAFAAQCGQVLAGWLDGGDVGVDTIRAAIAALRQQGALTRMPYWQSLLAETLLAAARVDEARAELRSAQDLAETSGDAWWLPEVLRLRSVLAEPVEPAQARALRERGLALARSHGSSALVERYER